MGDGTTTAELSSIIRVALHNYSDDSEREQCRKALNALSVLSAWAAGKPRPMVDTPDLAGKIASALGLASGGGNVVITAIGHGTIINVLRAAFEDE